MRPRRGNIPVDLTDLLNVKVDFTPLQTFVTNVKQKLRANGIDDSDLSIPNANDMVKVEQKPELLREVLVNQNNRLKKVEGRQSNDV